MRADRNLNVVALQYLRQFNPRLNVIGKLLRYFLQMLLQWNMTATIMMPSSLCLHNNDDDDNCEHNDDNEDNDDALLN